MPRKFFLLLSFPVLAAVLLSVGCDSRKAQSAAPPPVVPVAVAVAKRESVPLKLHAVGAVEASATVHIKSRIEGQLMSVRFVEGGDVKQGDLLFEIDSRPYREALRQAEAALARDTAQLVQTQANRARDIAQLKNAEAIAARYEALHKSGVISREQFDQHRTNADALREAVRADEAAIESARASIESDHAAIERAKLDLSYCEIRSPVSGRSGNLLVQAGNLVKANGEAALVVINQLRPIFVTFGVPEQHLATIRRTSRSRKLPVEVWLQDGSGKTVHGVLAVIDNTVDQTTGTIRLKASFNNDDRALWPGQFVDVALTLETRADATVIPSEAVQPGQKGQFVYVVKPDQTTEARIVTVGPTVGSGVIIENGIAPGETVVTDGQLRLFPGAHIRPVPTNQVESQAL